MFLFSIKNHPPDCLPWLALAKAAVQGNKKIPQKSGGRVKKENSINGCICTAEDQLVGMKEVGGV